MNLVYRTYNLDHVLYLINNWLISVSRGVVITLMHIKVNRDIDKRV